MTIRSLPRGSGILADFALRMPDEKTLATFVPDEGPYVVWPDPSAVERRKDPHPFRVHARRVRGLNLSGTVGGADALPAIEGKMVDRTERFGSCTLNSNRSA